VTRHRRPPLLHRLYQRVVSPVDLGEYELMQQLHGDVPGSGQEPNLQFQSDAVGDLPTPVTTILVDSIRWFAYIAVAAALIFALIVAAQDDEQPISNSYGCYRPSDVQL
jgi:hypothetical protein